MFYFKINNWAGLLKVKNSTQQIKNPQKTDSVAMCATQDAHFSECSFLVQNLVHLSFELIWVMFRDSQYPPGLRLHIWTFCSNSHAADIHIFYVITMLLSFNFLTGSHLFSLPHKISSLSLFEHMHVSQTNVQSRATKRVKGTKYSYLFVHVHMYGTRNLRSDMYI